MELWDVYDVNRNYTGKVIDRHSDEKLNEGEYHLVVEAIIINSKAELLLNKRSKFKNKYPSMWEGTGGSCIKGENSLQAILRELKEELGLDFNEKDAKTQELNELQSKIDTLCKEKNRLFSNYQSISDKYKDLLGRYEKVQILYPTADNEVTKMIEEEIRQRDISIAKEVDLCIQKIINLPASKDIISELEKARNCYSNLNQRQKTYVQSDINKLKLLYDESLLLKRNYDKMKKEQKEAELRRKRKKEEEEAEFRRRREEEDRRRRSHSSFGSSSHSGGHHGGFGGHSGGGGASRGF